MDYYKSQVENGKNDQKKLFWVVQELMHLQDDPALPSYTSAEELAESSSDFFITKIKRFVKRSMSKIVPMKLKKLQNFPRMK